MPPEEQLAVLLNRVKKLIAEGNSLRKTADILQEEGVPLPNTRWKKWHHSAVRWCLDQEKALPPAAVEIEVHGPYTAADRRLWGVLVRLTGAELEKAGSQKLSVSNVLDTVELDREQLGAALDRLSRTGLKWIGHAAPGLTVRSALLASSTLSGDILSVHFAPHLVKLLRNTKQYARIQALLEEKAGQAGR